MPQNKREAEQGNVFLIILMGIILFAALSFSISRGMRSDNTSNLSNQEAALAAGDLVAHAQKIERAVNKMRSKGVSENDISFENNIVGTYTNPNCADDSCKVFHPGGGRISFRSANDFISSLTTNFEFNGSNRFATFGCETQTLQCSELVLYLNMNETPEVCLKINDLAGIDNPSDDAPQLREWIAAPDFVGTYTNSPVELVGGANATTEAPEVNGKVTGCVYEYSGGQDTYRFYYILIAR